MVSEGRRWEKAESRVPPVDYGHQLVSGRELKTVDIGLCEGNIGIGKM